MVDNSNLPAGKNHHEVCGKIQCVYGRDNEICKEPLDAHFDNNKLVRTRVLVVRALCLKRFVSDSCCALVHSQAVRKTGSREGSGFLDLFTSKAVVRLLGLF